MIKYFSKKIFFCWSSQFLLLVLCQYFYVVAYGQDVSIKNGVNIQASYYNRGRVNMGWDLMKTYPEIEALRIEIEPDRAIQARRWIQEAQENEYQVIATYHRAARLGSDNKSDLLAAANWWRTHYKSLSSGAPFIINIMNEWGSHALSPTEYADAYNEAIAIIREVYDGTLIVDVPGFGQATSIAADALSDFQDKNIIFSVHIYSSAFNEEENRWLQEEDLAYLEAAGATCMVGEFCDASRGGTDWCSLIDYCYNQGWPLFGWAWNGDGGTMNMIEPHWRNQPLATTFRATPFMDKIIDKLAGVPCYTKPDKDCTPSNIGAACNDKNEYTINDRYNDYCHCTGNFTEFLSTNITNPTLLIYPNPVGEQQKVSIELVKFRGSGNLTIYNNSGQAIETVAVNATNRLINISTDQYVNGLYWAVFHNSKEVVVSGKFIK